MLEVDTSEDGSALRKHHDNLTQRRSVNCNRFDYIKTPTVCWTVNVQLRPSDKGGEAGKEHTSDHRRPINQNKYGTESIKVV